MFISNELDREWEKNTLMASPKSWRETGGQGCALSLIPPTWLSLLSDKCSCTAKKCLCLDLDSRTQGYTSCTKRLGTRQ